MTLNEKQLKALQLVDPDSRGAYERLREYDAQLAQLRDNRDVANDYVEDTLSLDQVILKISENRDDAAYRLNWACKKANLNLHFDYVS